MDVGNHDPIPADDGACNEGVYTDNALQVTGARYMCKGKCRECDGPIGEGKRLESVFCSSKCRGVFNNRRQVRGAELYDLFMAMRYDREKSKTLGVWAFICKLAQTFREEDVAKRQGFVSWLDPKSVMDRKPWLKAQRIG